MAKLMIVDDMPIMRKMLRDIVVEMGHEVVAEASSGLEAAELYAKVNPDIVTMDITMPGMDGIAATRAIIQIDPRAKIIMCSSVGQHSIMMDAISAGASDFAVKPISKHRVMEAIQNILSK